MGLHLALADGSIVKCGGRSNNGDMGYIDNTLGGQNTMQQNLLEEQVLQTSDNVVNYSNKPHQHPCHFIFTTIKGR